MAGDYLQEIRDYLKRMLSPRHPWTPFAADVEVEDLDCFDETEDFIFVDSDSE